MICSMICSDNVVLLAPWHVNPIFHYLLCGLQAEPWPLIAAGTSVAFNRLCDRPDNTRSLAIDLMFPRIFLSKEGASDNDTPALDRMKDFYLQIHPFETMAHHDAVDEARAAHDGSGIQVCPHNVEVQGHVQEVVCLQRMCGLSIGLCSLLAGLRPHPYT